MTDTPSPDAPTEPSKAALDEARRILAEMVHWKVGDFYDGTGAAKLADALDRFRAAGVREWQPIETAPKEEDHWILAIRTGSIIPMVTGWDEDREHWFTFNLWYETMKRRKEPGWKWLPTHWMPLPEPPHD